MSQLAYTIDPVRAVEGGLHDASFHRDIVSKLAQADIPFGRFVTRHTAGDDDQVRLPALTGEVTATGVGFAIADTSKESPVIGGSGGLHAATEAVPVMKRGRIVLVPEDAVTAGDGVFVRFTDGGGALTIGRVRSDVDGGEAVALPGATFVEDAGAGELCVVDLNL